MADAVEDDLVDQSPPELEAEDVEFDDVEPKPELDLELEVELD